ncbi:hypothetical protein pb186bvf_009323 [Paramecium bursaria]
MNIIYQNIDDKNFINHLNRTLIDLPAHPEELQLQETQDIEGILQLYDQLKYDVQNIEMLNNFKQLIDEISVGQSYFYKSCLKKYQQFVSNLELITNNKISQLNLRVDVNEVKWIRQTQQLLPNIEDTLRKHFQELFQLSLCNKDQITNSGFYAKDCIQLIKDNNHIELRVSFDIKSQRQVIDILCGYLEFCDILELNLHSFIVQIISETIKSKAIKQTLIIDEYENNQKYKAYIEKCISQSEIVIISQKKHQYTLLDELKQNLVEFKNKYLEQIEKISFEQQSKSLIKSFIFQQKNEPVQKQQSSLFQQLMVDLTNLNKYIDQDKAIVDIVIDHYKLIDIFLQNKQLKHNFQSLNFYVSVYSQIEAQIKKLQGDEYFEYWLYLKMLIREYQGQLNEISDLQ